MFGKIGMQELLIVLVIVIIIFGPKQLPKLARMFGKTMKGFKSGMDGEENGDKKAEDEEE
ncbi:MAG: twin-arginine translocase TatA/TatE family subunit [Eubacteriales bacterium]|nr:twin-arginine translocase TatA/TatE family subunit [Eubacteriales bacterium]